MDKSATVTGFKFQTSMQLGQKLHKNYFKNYKNMPRAVKRRQVTKGTWTVGIDDSEVPVTGKEVIVTRKEGTVKKRSFKAKGEGVKIKDKTRFR